MSQGRFKEPCRESGVFVAKEFVAVVTVVVHGTETAASTAAMTAGAKPLSGLTE